MPYLQRKGIISALETTLKQTRHILRDKQKETNTSNLAQKIVVRIFNIIFSIVPIIVGWQVTAEAGNKSGRKMTSSQAAATFGCNRRSTKGAYKRGSKGHQAGIVVWLCLSSL